jgi:hypothetical protein
LVRGWRALCSGTNKDHGPIGEREQCIGTEGAHILDGWVVGAQEQVHGCLAKGLKALDREVLLVLVAREDAGLSLNIEKIQLLGSAWQA